MRMGEGGGEGSSHGARINCNCTALLVHPSRDDLHITRLYFG